MVIVTVHVVVIGGMLLQGCKDTSSNNEQSKHDAAASNTSDTTPMASNPAPAAPQAEVPPTVNPNISNVYAGTSATSVPAPQLQPGAGLAPPAKSTDLAQPSAPGEAAEYVIAKGDTLGAIARKNGLSLKALMEANPGVNAKKLKIGQKVQIPAGAAAAAAASTPGAAAEAASAESTVYVVKSGDMLFRIAKTHGTTVKKIMALNDLRSTSIRAGQKLKLPAPKTSTPEPAAAPASASAVQMPRVATPTLPSPVASN